VSQVNEKIMRILEFLTSFFLLNILWLLFCLPVMTIFPATVAMYCVIRQWILHKEYSVFRPFIHFFKKNFKLGFLLGLVWLAFAGIFSIDYFLMENLGEFQSILLPILTIFGTLFLSISSFIFSTIANYNVHFMSAIKNSLFFSVRYFPTTIASIFLLALCVLFVLTWSVTFFFIFSVYAYVNYLLCYRVFTKISAVQPE
jgi:uncharacterized membrane protein YesL